MSMEIDWSKAPADATHAQGGEMPIIWYRVCETRPHLYFWTPAIARWTPSMFSLTKFSELPGIEQRPVAWNGEGLPPVGIECEHLCFKTWERVHVFAVHPNGNGSSSAIFTRPDGTWRGCADPKSFRPIRTPEQIAEEERQRAIDVMIESKIAGGLAPWVCGELYDAGYRKTGAHEPLTMQKIGRIDRKQVTE